MLISWFISHRHGRRGISAISKPIYITAAIASPRVRANFIRHTRRFFSDRAPVLRPEKGHTAERPQGRPRWDAGEGTQIASARSASHVAPPGQPARRLRPSVRPSVRPVIIGELLLFYGRGHTLASARLSRTAIRPG